MATLFSLNVNKIALLRNSRGTNYPDLEHYVKKAIDLGVKSITIHPRPDQRHIRYTDLPKIHEIVRSYPDVELNIEGFPNDDFIRLVRDIQPDQVTLVPDDNNQLTSDHGWNITEQRKLLLGVIPRLKDARICLFWDPSPEGLEKLLSMGVDGIELYTEPFVNAFQKKDNSILEQYGLTFDKAKTLGLRVNAGHDLNLKNLSAFLARCQVDEVSIGHAFTVEAFDVGCEHIIHKYHEICGNDDE